MVYVMLQGSRVRGVFDSVWLARVFFSDTTGVALGEIEEFECFTGHVLLRVSGYTQARLVPTTYR